MAKRRGCMGCLVSLLIFVVILVGGVLGVYNFASPSTFGIRSIGDFELGELADYKFKDLWGAIQNISKQPEKGEVVDNTYTDSDKQAAQDKWGADSSSSTPDSGFLGQINSNTPAGIDKIGSISDVFVKPITTTKHLQMDFFGNDFVYLFNECIDDIKNKGEQYAQLKELIEMFSVDGNTPIVIEETALSLSDGQVKIKIVFQLDITKFKADIDAALEQIPAFIRPKIDSKLYITTISNAVVADSDGSMTVAENQNSLKINTLDEKMSDMIMGLIIDQMNVQDMDTQKIAATVADAFATVVNNLGGVGTLDAQTPVYGKSAISGDPKEKGGAISIITRTAA